MKAEIIKAEEFGLKKKQVGNVDLAFAEKAAERKLLSKVYAKIIKKDIDVDVAIEAREFRLKAVKVKSAIASIHKTQKEFSLAYGKYCDAWKRKETEPVQQMIDGAMKIEKFQELAEQKRVTELKAKRVAELELYDKYACERNLGAFEEDEYQALFQAKKKEHEGFVEAELKAEKERIEKEVAAKLENERIRKQNQKLEKAAEKARAEQKRLAKIQEKKDEKVRKELDDLKAKQFKELADLAKVEAAKLEKVKIEQKKTADALFAKVEKELKEKADAEAKIEHDLNKGDAEKVEELIVGFLLLKEKYTFKSAKNKKMYSQVGELINKVVTHIKK